jgi:hypothetical protein
VPGWAGFDADELRARYADWEQRRREEGQRHRISASVGEE